MNPEYPNAEMGNGEATNVGVNQADISQDVWDQSNSGSSPGAPDAASNGESSQPLPAVQSVTEAELPLPAEPATDATVDDDAPVEAQSNGQSAEAASEAIAPAPPEPEFNEPEPEPEPLPGSVKELMALDIQRLQQERDRLQQDVDATHASMVQMIRSGTAELEDRRARLRGSIEKLEGRRERLREEMRTTFAGSSQRVASRVQGFKDFLISSLQDLTAAAEDLELVRPAPAAPAQPATPSRQDPQGPVNPQFARGRFEEETQRIRKILERYQMRPDYYGPPWRLRRTFESIHRERVTNWFGEQGGRGAIQSLGSRLQNILVVSATISVNRALYGDRLHVLVLIDSPERLGEWRRGLQDCLGISRGDFGPDRGVTLFDSAEALAQTADRTRRAGDLPFIIIDEAEGKVSLSLLQFPLWLAIAPDPRAQVYDYF